MTAGSQQADRQSALARAVARYHAGCLRVIGSQNVALRDVRTAKKAAFTCDLGVLTSEETLLATGLLHLQPPKKPRAWAVAPRPGPGAEADAELLRYQEQLLVWERVRELVQKAEIGRASCRERV